MNVRTIGLILGSYVAFAALAVIAHGPGTFALDATVSRWIIDAPAWSERPLARAIAWSMRSLPVAAAALVTACVLIRLHRIRDAVLVATVVPIMHLSYPLKEIVQSPRPGSGPEDWGFPAGRAGNALFIAGALALVSTWPSRRAVRWAVAVVWIMAAGWARVATGTQWAGDVVGAWLWGAPTLTLTSWLVRHQFRTRAAGRH